MKEKLAPIILTYHGILSKSSIIPQARETGADLYDVSIDQFKAQMNWLKENGYKAVSIEEAKRDNEKKVIITFDDGELNNFEQAFPILNELGWKAYFFIIVKRVGDKGYMRWLEIKQMADAGMLIGSHGLTHEILTNLLDSQMEEELHASKRTLEINLNIPIHSLSIPRGFCNDKVIQTAYGMGYKTVFISSRPMHLKSDCFSRIAVKSSWSLKRFKAAMEGKTPFAEMVGNLFIRGLKTIFRETGYNWIRSILIRIYQ